MIGTADDLILFAINTGNIYREHTTPIVRKLARYYAKGKFNKEAAERAFMPWTEIAAKQYCAEVIDKPVKWFVQFPVEARRIAARMALDYYMENIVKNDL